MYSDIQAEDSQEYLVAFRCSNAGSYTDCAASVEEYCLERMLLPAGFVPTSTAQRFGDAPASGGEGASIRPGLKDSFPHGQ